MVKRSQGVPRCGLFESRRAWHLLGGCSNLLSLPLEFADYSFEEHFGRPIPSFPPREARSSTMRHSAPLPSELRTCKAGVRAVPPSTSLLSVNLGKPRRTRVVRIGRSSLTTSPAGWSGRASRRGSRAAPARRCTNGTREPSLSLLSKLRRYRRPGLRIRRREAAVHRDGRLDQGVDPTPLPPLFATAIEPGILASLRTLSLTAVALIAVPLPISEGGEERTELFDYVLCCTGHFSVPNVAA